MKPERQLIDKAVLLAQMAKRLPVEDDISDVVTNCVKTAKRLVQKAPAVEAVEVVHAHWIKTDRGMKCSNPECRCLSAPWDDNLKSTFCPWCGARMDGDGDG